MTIVMAALLVLAMMPLGVQGKDEPDLSGRLGGTYASFVERYGKPVDTNPSIGQLFGVDGYGLVAAQFSRLAAPSDDASPALLITLRSERPDETSATTPDDADWNLDETQSRIADFVPADAVVTDFTEGGDGSLYATCSSAALEAAFGTLGADGCSIRAVQSEAGRVSFVTLSLATSDNTDQAASPDECDNAAGWAQESGDRLKQATTLLQSLAELDPERDDASEQLNALQQSFTQLADEQRASAAPGAAATANFYLIGAFTGYAGAITDVINGLEQQDEAVIKQATTAISEANAKVDRAATEIEALVNACRLAVASPEATPEG